MDLEIDDSKGVVPNGLGNTEIGSNGSCHHDKAPGGSSPLPTVSKGTGLRKWRRIRREGGGEGYVSNLDSGKVLKRGMSNSAGNANLRHGHVLGEVKEKSEGSVSSTNAVVKVVGNVPFGVVMSGGDSGSVDGPVFVAGTESENSEDRSSKSSTAASAPRSWYDTPPVMGYGRDKNKMWSPSGKNSGNYVSAQQKAQQGKSRVETSKKARGERVKIEKENSHSSMESDSRSSNFVFMQGHFSETSNGRRNGKLANYDGENSDDAHDDEQHLREENHTGFSINEAESEDASQGDMAADLSWQMKENKNENHGSSTNQDALMECITALQTVQEVLEKELETFRHIGNEDTSPSDDTVEGEDLLPEFNAVGPEVDDRNSSDHESSEKQIINLKETVLYLESKLMEAKFVFDMKEAKVIELEAILNSWKSSKEESGESSINKEAELEVIFRQRIEAEIEYLAKSETIQLLRVGVVDQIRLLEEERGKASKQAQVLNKLEDGEKKATMLKIHAEKLNSSCEEIVERNEVIKLETKVSKLSWCFLIQLILLVLALVFFVSQLSPYYGNVVPT